MKVFGVFLRRITIALGGREIIIKVFLPIPPWSSGTYGLWVSILWSRVRGLDGISLSRSLSTFKSRNYIELSGLLSIGLLLIRYPRAPNDYTTLCYCTFSTIHFVSIWWTWITSNIYIHPIETKLCGTTCTRVCALEDSRKGTSTLKWELHILKILMHDGHN